MHVLRIESLCLRIKLGGQIEKTLTNPKHPLWYGKNGSPLLNHWWTYAGIQKSYCHHFDPNFTLTNFLKKIQKLGPYHLSPITFTGAEAVAQ